ncbi:MAG TPA: acyltransferase, partial [Catalimonadaceae bacterium]|nr:acyltransferase [Catalimonadaceae bacterium]
KAVFFSGLNEIRAIAALSVLFHHVELYKHKLGIESLYDVKFLRFFISTLGHNGVLLFFTLSGFLITYLLLVEKKESGDINSKNFYLRRILRIWPVYFICLVFGFVVIPILYSNFSWFFIGQHTYNKLIDNIEYGWNLILNIFFLSNCVTLRFPGVVGASQNWSVSVEEQFYLFWPWVVKWANRFFIHVMVGIIVVIGLLPTLFRKFPFLLHNNLFEAFIKSFFIDYMAVGALAAYAYLKYPHQIKWFIRNPFFLLSGLVLMIFHLQFSGIHFLRAISFAIVILASIEWKLSIRPLDYLGKISYGLYMYHPMVMYLIFALFTNLKLPYSWINLFVYLGVISGTLLVSLCSYKFIELPLLRKKDKFATVKSGKPEI